MTNVINRYKLCYCQLPGAAELPAAARRPAQPPSVAGADAPPVRAAELPAAAGRAVEPPAAAAAEEIPAGAGEPPAAVVEVEGRANESDRLGSCSIVHCLNFRTSSTIEQ